MAFVSIKDDLRSFRRSWVHHTGMQLATFSVLAATLTVVGFVLSLSLHLNRILMSWGESARITAYLLDDLNPAELDRLRESLQSMKEVRAVAFVPREAATGIFKRQMASYAPDLLVDPDFENPFPASFRISLRGGVHTERDVEALESLVNRIARLQGIEEVTYGQSWIRNYSSFVTAVSTGGGIVVAIMLAGSLFVVGNSIRASVAARREEIEILELVGATSAMIRRPYLTEGVLMGLLAAFVALAVHFAIYAWLTTLMNSSLAFAGWTSRLGFMNVPTVLTFLGGSAFLGGVGAWVAIRNINQGWSASRRLDA